jgi:hypothetical protein
MAIRLPLTIEIFGLEDGEPVILDRVVGATVYVDEAKRIGRRLLSKVDAGTQPKGYRILCDYELIYTWQIAHGDETNR